MHSLQWQNGCLSYVMSFELKNEVSLNQHKTRAALACTPPSSTTSIWTGLFWSTWAARTGHTSALCGWKDTSPLLCPWTGTLTHYRHVRTLAIICSWCSLQHLQPSRCSNCASGNDFSVFHFGASTRNYVIRERPQTGARPVMEEIEKTSMTAEGDKGAALLGKFAKKFLSKWRGMSCCEQSQVIWWLRILWLDIIIGFWNFHLPNRAEGAL